MKLPLLTLPAALSPLKALPALKVGIADLARARRAWSSLMPDTGAAEGEGALEPVVSFGPNPGALRLLRFVPKNLPPGAPLVVVLHGCTQTAAGYDKGTGWSTLAARHGFAVIYPEQQRSNNAHTCFNWFEPEDIRRGSGEVASIHAMVAATLASLRCDPARVFVTGLSAGGAMTAALLATYPDVFAAGAIVAGLPYGSAHSAQEAFGAMYQGGARAAADRGSVVRAASPSPQRKPIVSIWHGDADTTVTPANATELAKQWCDVHGLAERDAVPGTVDGARHRQWRDAAGMTRVELFQIPGLPHGTPIDTAAKGDRGVGKAMPYLLESTISATWHSAHSWGFVGRLSIATKPKLPSRVAR